MRRPISRRQTASPKSYGLLWLTVALALGTLTITGAAVALAQDEEVASTVFTDTVDVDIVNVDVFVTNRKGEPVLGLVPADFAIFEDGQPVKISNFYAVHGGRPQIAGEVIEGMVEPALAAEMTAVPIIPADQQLHMALFIDNMNMSPPQRNRALAQLRRFVDSKLKPEDRVMVASFQGPSVEIKQGFTSDPEKLLATFDELSRETSMTAASYDWERRNILKSIAQAQLPVQSKPSGISPGNRALAFAVAEAEAIFESIEVYDQRHQNQTYVTLGALQRFMQSMAGVPGRKAVVYVSEGLSLRPGEALFSAWQGKFSILGSAASRMTSAIGANLLEFNVERAFRDLGRIASTNRVTFYGLRVGSIFHLSAEDGMFDLGAITTEGGGQIWTAAMSAVDNANRGSTLRDLADATGGFAITNAGSLGVALDRLRQDFDSYYSLGYMPTRPADDKRHRITVKASGDRKLRVRHRENYNDKSRLEMMRERTLSALVFEEGGNPLQVSVDVAPAQRDKKGHQRVPVMVKVPVSNLVLIPGEGVYEGRVSIHIGARDTKGRTSQIRTVQVPVRITRDELRQAAGKLAGHRFLLEMRAGEHVVVVGVRDELGGVESTTLVEQPALSKS